MIEVNRQFGMGEVSNPIRESQNFFDIRLLEQELRFKPYKGKSKFSDSIDKRGFSTVSNPIRESQNSSSRGDTFFRIKVSNPIRESQNA